MRRNVRKGSAEDENSGELTSHFSLSSVQERELHHHNEMAYRWSSKFQRSRVALESCSGKSKLQYNAQRYYRTSAMEFSSNVVEKVALKGRARKIRE